MKQLNINKFKGLYWYPDDFYNYLDNTNSLKSLKRINIILGHANKFDTVYKTY